MPMTADLRRHGVKREARVYWFSRLKEVERGAFVRGEEIVCGDASARAGSHAVGEITLKGAHNLENVLAAVCMGMLPEVEAGSDPRRRQGLQGR